MSFNTTCLSSLTFFFNSCHPDSTLPCLLAYSNERTSLRFHRCRFLTDQRHSYPWIHRQLSLVRALLEAFSACELLMSSPLIFTYQFISSFLSLPLRLTLHSFFVLLVPADLLSPPMIHTPVLSAAAFPAVTVAGPRLSVLRPRHQYCLGLMLAPPASLWSLFALALKWMRDDVLE